MNKKNAAMPVIRADQVVPSHAKKPEPNIVTLPSQLLLKAFIKTYFACFVKNSLENHSTQSSI